MILCSHRGASDTMAPGPLLATVVHTVTGEDGSGLAGCSDDQLMGIISAARRQQSRDEWTVMAAMAEYASRHSGTKPLDEFAADELAFELHMTQQSAAGQMEFATDVAKRLPATFAALGAGLIHPIHLRIIEDQTRILTDADAARADAFLAAAAPRHDLRRTPLRHAQARSQAGPRRRPQAQRSRHAGDPRPPVPQTAPRPARPVLGLTVPAETADPAVPAPLPVPARMPARAWPPWSPSPSP
jgi:hypothetical protein